MKLVVGLGNPGKKYQGTRHNVGFEVVTELANRFDIGRPKAKFNSEIAEVSIRNEKTILVSPLTFMNLSGQAVRAAVDFYKMELPDLLIICDDLALDLGRLRLKKSGSAGGQNGLKDIINRLGTNEFSRLRVGIGKTPQNWDAADYVLSKFSDEDKSTMEKAVKRAADAVEVWVGDGTELAMSKFNADPNKPQKKKEKKTRSRVADADSSESVDTDSGSAKPDD